MKPQLPNPNSYCKTGTKLFPTCRLSNIFGYLGSLLMAVFTFYSGQSNAQETKKLLPPVNTWTPPTSLAPDANRAISPPSNGQTNAQETGTLLPPVGTWAPLTHLAPDANGGVMILLSNGTIMAKTFTGGSYGNVWDRLTPDATGSYANGTWSTI